MITNLPRCYCPKEFSEGGRDFFGAVKGGTYYQCKLNKCGFKQLVNQGVDLREGEDQEVEDLDEYEDDGFVVFEEELEEEGDDESGSDGSYNESDSSTKKKTKKKSKKKKKKKTKKKKKKEKKRRKETCARAVV